jgi:hypothetical protein
MLSEDYKTVLVVGGELSGLTAAKTKVIVQEAASEVGGGTLSVNLEGCTFDDGGMFSRKT